MILLPYKKEKSHDFSDVKAFTYLKPEVYC